MSVTDYYKALFNKQKKDIQDKINIFKNSFKKKELAQGNNKA